MNPTFFEKIAKAHFVPKALPGVREIDEFISSLMQFLFPEQNNVRLKSNLEIETQFNIIKISFEQLLLKTKACEQHGIESTCHEFFEQLDGTYDKCIEDARAIFSGDPAAVDLKEVIRSYPGFYAIAIYRIAHLMLTLDIPYLPRIFSEYAHARTGIDIHPGAVIGRHFCIDHGTGVVIGETTVIGDHVKIYQGVTLGALSVSKEMAKTKRHPTIGDNVVIYAGATILGGEADIGSDSLIGGNVWITGSLPPNSRVLYESKDVHLIPAE